MSLTLVPAWSKPLNVAVVGTGISDIAAAWLMARKHRASVYEKDDRLGGHTRTENLADCRIDTALDTGISVYNERDYPNLVDLFDYLGIQTYTEDRQGDIQRFDHVVIDAHADQVLAMLADPDSAERKLLGRFRYDRNLALLHSDERLMPHTRRAWFSRNFMSRGLGDEQKVSVAHWMNRLRQFPTDRQLFVSLNPLQQQSQGKVLRSFLYQHPVYDHEAIDAQRLLWNLQGVRRTWYCGAHFGHGFHEGGLQAGLAVAEQLGGLTRPWTLADPNSRIHCNPLNSDNGRGELAA